MHFYISFIFTCVLIYTNMKGCLSFGNPSILKTSLFVHILDISATWIQQIALFFPFGNLKCWHVMTYPKESLLKTNEMLKTALSSFILVHRHVTGCVRWRMKHFLTDTKRSQKWITFSLLTHIPTSGEWTDFDPEENKVGQSNKCTYWETAEIVLLKWDLFCVVFSLLTYNLTIKNIL